MMKRFNSEKRKLPKGRPQCYITANIVYDNLSKKDKCITSTHDKMILKASMRHLYKLTPSINVIELNIIEPYKRKNSPKLKNSFWIPRIFNHSFNILILEKNVIISQSWFRIHNYKVIEKLSHSQFLKWLDVFRANVNNYLNDPIYLFSMFHNNHPDKDLIHHIKTSSKKMKIEFLLKYSFTKSSCSDVKK